jgi:phospholipid/cholesterol/gamma-HCH transport system permease protein
MRYPVLGSGANLPFRRPAPMAISAIDRTAKQIVLTVQEYSLFASRALLNLFRPPIYWTDFLIQSDIIGVGSLPIVFLSGFFTGGVLALQSAATLSEFGAAVVTGQFVSLTMIRELGPVLTGIMVAGRNSSSMASELGSMVVTEQIDAMRALGVDPMRKLVTPRICASIVMLLFLVIVADAFGIMGGAAVTVLLNHQNGTQYFHMAYEHLHYPDIIQGLVKPLFFGYILGSTGCFYGMRTTGGTEGVGRATILAVVNSSVLIIAVDFVITHILLTVFPT